MGAPLFDRHRDGVQPTDLGQYVITHARRLVAGLDELRTEVERLTASDLTTVRIAAPATVLPLIVAELRTRVPGASVHSIAERYNTSLIEGVVSGSLSFAVTHEFSGPDQALPDTLESAALLREPVFVGLHPDHPLAAASRPWARAERQGKPPAAQATGAGVDADAVGRGTPGPYRACVMASSSGPLCGSANSRRARGTRHTVFYSPASPPTIRR
ncbi:hypothetical protein GCM10012280_45170 [Wenjunlia tyrosinilytica]|uniref:HTH lysR-type domain-containing protein n=2 Tax=Wenjunlia tyrosinilytica TaxID=1544741 RepID=A0A918E0J7_9ACTN|nr:hypothetical protein GCM10012280_45170 [Wenjunlia tyrosinilytica]